MTASGSVDSGAARRPETVLEILRAAERWLAGRGVDAPRRSAELLVGHVLDCDRLRVYLAHDRPMSEEERGRLRKLVARRGEHEPIAYLLGTQPFRAIDLRVGPGVLVPRPETEELAGHAVAALASFGAEPRVVDLGTGSGCLAVAIACEVPDARVVAVDVSRDALEFARRNAQENGVLDRVELRCGSWWDALEAGDGPFDLLVSNPPYVDPAGPDPVEEGVRRHEPEQALFTPAGEPARCYADIVAGIARHLSPGAHLWFESGGNAVDAGLEVLSTCTDLVESRSLTDLAGRARFLHARRSA